MKSADIKKIDELMKQKRWDEAQKLMEDLFSSQEFYEQERGRSFIAYTMMYMEALIAINQQYKAALEQANALLKNVNRAESEIYADIDLTRLKAEIGKM